MIVVCSGMSRSGSTVQYQLIKEFVERTGKGIGMGPWNATKVKLAANNEINEIVVFKSERSIGDYINIVDHSFSVIRNPFDVAVSLYRYRIAKEYYTCEGNLVSLNDIINEEMVQVIDWIKFWIGNDTNILRYEDLHPYNWGNVIRQAANVLEIEYNEKMLSEIVEEYSLEKNIYRMKYIKQWFDFTESMLTLAHIGPERGKAGLGQDILNDKQKETILSYASDFMEEYGYSL